ncbi:hypothetical protein [Streptomyces sp. NPDC057250]|uniref:hypothetical protein n=1 Tax=unclassified Streptomyces TaxID=2593676 RepID=UPI0036416827
MRPGPPAALRSAGAVRTGGADPDDPGVLLRTDGPGGRPDGDRAAPRRGARGGRLSGEYVTG